MSAWSIVGAAEDVQETSLPSRMKSIEPAFDLSLNHKC